MNFLGQRNEIGKTLKQIVIKWNDRDPISFEVRHHPAMVAFDRSPFRVNQNIVYRKYLELTKCWVLLDD